MADPLKQFEIKTLVPIEIGGVDLSFTNASLWMMLTFLSIAFVMVFLTRKQAMIPSRGQNIPELMYEMIKNMTQDIIGYEGRKYIPFIFSIFTIVLFGNLLGMIPYGFTITSHIIVTAALGLLVVGIVTVMGFVNHGVRFLTLFAPAGIPWPIYFIIIPIELISFLSRPVTLALRLCANMTAGHIMLKVFAAFSVQAGIIFGIGPMIFNAAIVGFELLVAVLQAYIFTILSCIYIKDAIELH